MVRYAVANPRVPLDVLATPVCWSDEGTFYVGENNNVFYVTRGANEEFLAKNLKPTFKSGRTKVGVWSCFCGEDMGPLVIIPKGGTMTAQRYIEVLKKNFILFYWRTVYKYGLEVVMQEDNASWHKAAAVREFLKKQRVKYISWPPQSPDLTPIENLWKQIKGRRRVNPVFRAELAWLTRDTM
jgi:transposase